MMTLEQIAANPSTVVVDVRSTLEYNSGHITGALNIPVDQLPARLQDINGLGKNPVIFYCRSGNRSGSAVAYLQQQGYNNVYNGGSLEAMLYYVKGATYA